MTMAEVNPSEKLQETELKALSQYVSDTFNDIKTVKDFLNENSKWMLLRETEFNKLVNIKKRAQKKSPELEKELAAVLEDTLSGLKQLQHFLDAVEKLAVTSVQVFQEFQDIINAAQTICPQLVEFKRDAKAFFSPKLQNVEVLAYQLDKYIKAVRQICGTLKEGPFSKFCFTKSEVDIETSLRRTFRRTLSHIKELNELRMDEAFRMVFMFQEDYSFIKKFSKRQPQMLQFLDELEDSAVQLDRMNKGAKISSVAGSSVGAAGGVLSIIGLALIPVTAGVSLALTMTGVGLGITSGVNSVVTTATEIGVNCIQQKRASENFEKFMEDVKILQDCLDEVTFQNIKQEVPDVAICVNFFCKGANVAKGIYNALGVSAVKAVAEEANALRNVPRVAAELPDIGQAAARGPLALSKAVRGGFIAFNALFLGMDVFFIVKDSIGLAKGSETEVSKFIRARAALWRSEMDAWQKIHDSLKKVQSSFQKKQAILKPDIERKQWSVKWAKENGLLCFTIALVLLLLHQLLFYFSLYF